MKEQQFMDSTIQDDRILRSKKIEESNEITDDFSRNQINEKMESDVSTLKPVFKETRTLKVILRRLEDENVAELIKKAVAEVSLKSKPKKKKIKSNGIKKRCRKPKKRSKKRERSRYQFKCSKCSKRFSSQDRLAEHNFSNCDTERVFGCDICDKKFVFKRYLIEHKTPICHSLKTYKCKICQKSFRKNRNLKSHMSSVHGEGPPKAVTLCDICGKCVTGGNIRFQDHLRLHSGERPFSCQHCGKLFRTKRDMMKHSTSHSEKKRLVCAVCGKGFKNMTYLRTHMRVHGMVTSKNVHKCYICGKLMDSRSRLSRHLMAHLNKKQHVCKICQAVFETSKDLKNHATTLHLEQMHYTCEVCGRKLANNRSLKKHMLTHSVQMYPCTLCSKSFKSHETLKQHLSIHSGERPYSCIICGKRFGQYSKLKQHMFTHSVNKPYQCSFCQKSFISNSVLKIHIRLHTGEKPFACKLCGKTFACTKHLKVHHQRVHMKHIDQSKNVTTSATGNRNEKNNENIELDEKPILCKVCGIVCATNSDLEIHLTNIHLSNLENMKCVEKVSNYNTNSSFLLPTDNNKPFLCKLSDVLCRTSNDLEVHVQSLSNKPEFINCLGNIKSENYISSKIIPDNEKPLLCNICGMSCTTVNDLEIHSQQAHSNKPENIHFNGNMGNVLNNTSSTTSIGNGKTFSCDLCGICFPTVKDLELHILTHSDRPEESNSLSKVENAPNNISSFSLTDNNTTQTDKICCDICKKEFTKRYSLTRHVLTVHDKKKLKTYECKFCNKLLSRLDRLKKHIATHHKVTSADDLTTGVTLESSCTVQIISESDDKSQICKQCGQVFSCEQSLNVHYNLCKLKLGSFEGYENKPDQKMFCCAVCKAGFKTLDALSLHMIIHETPTTSPSASKSYGPHNGHHFELNILDCNHCERKFTKINDLKTHMKTHSIIPFKCGICHISFNQLDVLRQHINTEHQNITFSNEKNDDNKVLLSLDQTLQHKDTSQKHKVITRLEEENKLKISENDKNRNVLDLDYVVQCLTGETSIDLEADVEISFNNY